MGRPGIGFVVLPDVALALAYEIHRAAIGTGSSSAAWCAGSGRLPDPRPVLELAYRSRRAQPRMIRSFAHINPAQDGADHFGDRQTLQRLLRDKGTQVDRGHQQFEQTHSVNP